MYALTATAAPPGVQLKFRCELQDVIDAIPHNELLVLLGDLMLGLKCWALMRNPGGVCWEDMGRMIGIRQLLLCVR